MISYQQKSAFAARVPFGSPPIDLRSILHHQLDHWLAELERTGVVASYR